MQTEHAQALAESAGGWRGWFRHCDREALLAAFSIGAAEARRASERAGGRGSLTDGLGIDRFCGPCLHLSHPSWRSLTGALTIITQA